MRILHHGGEGGIDTRTINSKNREFMLISFRTVIGLQSQTGIRMFLVGINAKILYSPLIFKIL